MARRGRPRKPKAVTMPSHIIMVDVDNPHFSHDHAEDRTNPRRVAAAMSMRESPAVWMHAHGQMDAAQFQAATRFRRLFEQAGGGGAKAMDTTKEPVDGGRISDGITQAKIDAGRELARIHGLMPAADFQLVEAVCGQCLWLYEITPSKRAQVIAGRDLRRSLDILAVWWGFAKRAA